MTGTSETVQTPGGRATASVAFRQVKDSGARQEFDTGSRRDTQEGKPRLDLIPTLWLRRLGTHLANGAVKYGDNNWQKGQPVSRYYGSAMRHMLAWHDAEEDEDHFAAAAWNVLAAMWTVEEVRAGRLPDSLDDRTAPWVDPVEPPRQGERLHWFCEVATHKYARPQDNELPSITEREYDLTNEYVCAACRAERQES